MGAPELPTDVGEEHLHTPALEHPQIRPLSDESDDGEDAYDGYQPLAMEDDGNIFENPAIAPHMASTTQDADLDLATASVSYGDPNMPPIESADSEIERQVWSQPRPRELQIDLDKTRTEQILMAMSKITLPDIKVPDWAVGVPEERWKNELLERIQNRKPDGEPKITSESQPTKSQTE